MNGRGKIKRFLAVLLCLCLAGCAPAGNAKKQLAESSAVCRQDSYIEEGQAAGQDPAPIAETTADLTGISAYSGQPYVQLSEFPAFSEKEKLAEPYEDYSELDGLGRCGVARACLGQELMPTEKRGNISAVKPSGWQRAEYDCVEGKSLYNRCHLIGFQLAGENANERNLITGTRYMNTEGMLPFENLIADYIKETGNRVLYRVTPVFEGENLVASGVQMEAYSVEDEGEGICFNVFVYNVQPGVVIDYATGSSELAANEAKEEPESVGQSEEGETELRYILNTKSKKFHYEDCPAVGQMNEANRKEYSGTRDEVVGMGYTACKQCNP